MQRILLLITTFLLCTEYAVSETWLKATSMQDITDGQKVIFVCEEHKKELNGFVNYYGTASTYTDTPSGSYPFIIEMKEEQIYFKSSTENKYLDWQGSSTNLALVASSNKKPWSVSFNEGTVSILSTANKRYLRYCYTASNSKGFKLYTSSAEEAAVSIYVLRTGKTDRKLQFETTECTADLSNDFVAPTVGGITTDATWSSSNTSVATVNEETGEITLQGVGTTTITVTAPETDEYYYATASYELIVTDAANTHSLTMNFTNPEAIAAWNITLPSKGNNSTLPTNIFSEEIKMTSTHGTTSTSIYNDANGNYSLRVYKSGSIKLSVPDAYEITNIEINGSSLNNGSCSPNSYVQSNRITWSGNTQAFTYNSEDGTCTITSINITYSPYSVRPETKTITISSAGLSTFSSAHAWTLPLGLTAATATVEGDILKLHERYTANAVIPAATGVVLIGESGDYILTQPEEDEGLKDESNILKPLLTNTTITAEDNHKLYILANDPVHGLGFYYQGATNDGTHISKIGERAYLQLAESKNINSLKIELPSTTSISIIPVSKHSESIYTLQGIKTGTTHLPTGIYIVNGKKQLITK